MKIRLLIICFCLFSASITQAKEVPIASKIQGLYIGYFNRAADKDGLDFWVNRAGQSNNTRTILKELSAGFATHPTFFATYASLSNQDFVKAIYKNVLGKAGDIDGITAWTQILDRGVQRSDMVSDFIDSSLTSELTTESFPNLSTEDLAIAQQRQDLISNKVSVAENFTRLLAQHTKIQNTSHPEDDPAYLASIKILANVTIAASSASSQISYLSSIAEAKSPIDEINGTTPQGGGDPTDDIPILSNSEITEYLNAINQARSVQQDCHSEGVFPAVPALTWNDKLYKSSYEHSHDLAITNTFSHSGSGASSDWTGIILGKQSTPFERIKRYNYLYRTAGENIAAGTFTTTASIVVQQWLDSDPHCANIMHSGFTEVGMAMVREDHSLYTHYWTQNFGAPRAGSTSNSSTSSSSSTSSKTIATSSTSISSIIINCGSKTVCGQMSSCAEAYTYLNQCGLVRLDRDRDGIPCESICN